LKNSLKEMSSMSTLFKSAPSSENSTTKASPQVREQSLGASGLQNQSWSSTALELPKLTTAAVATAKAAGRIAATRISAAEHERLLKERQRLLDKKFGGTVTKSEENRLAYVRWSLDRIEDAKYGAALDVLEVQVSSYEVLKNELGKFYQQLDAKIPHRSK
jgi:hypothetical protein